MRIDLNQIRTNNSIFSQNFPWNRLLVRQKVVPLHPLTRKRPSGRPPRHSKRVLWKDYIDSEVVQEAVPAFCWHWVECKSAVNDRMKRWHDTWYYSDMKRPWVQNRQWHEIFTTRRAVSGERACLLSREARAGRRFFVADKKFTMKSLILAQDER